MKHPMRFLVMVALVGLLAACGDSNSPGGGGQFQLNIATRTAAPAHAQNLSLAPVTFTDGVNTLVITQIEMVVKELELEGADVEDCNAEAEAGDDAEGDDENEADDGCEEVEVEAFLLDLPLDAGAAPVITIPATAGTYDEFDFEVHAPDATEDNAFLLAHPDFAGVSIRVQGTWNGAPFVYVTDLEAEQEAELDPPIVVAEGGMASVTLLIDIATWFRAGNGSLIDPASAGAGQPNEALVEQNIAASFEAFEDDDHDGADDGGGEELDD
jgi:hypothetical protein